MTRELLEAISVYEGMDYEEVCEFIEELKEVEENQ